MSLRADPRYVSPNGDGIQDQAFFYPVLSGDGTVTRWRLDIDHDREGRVTRLSGAGMPALIMWDVLDRKGQRAVDGPYHARFEVWGRVGHLSNEDAFVVDTLAPSVQLAVSTNAVDLADVAASSVTFLPSAVDASPIDRWQLQIMDEVGHTIGLFWSTGAPHAVQWDARDRQSRSFVPSGRYRAAFEAWDAAGNASEPVFADVSVVAPVATPSAEDLKEVKIRSTRVGDYVPLASETLFEYRHGKIVMSDAAEAPLSEVADWVNARPGGVVILEGYSNAYHNAVKDRNLGSRYAWLVYSRLVKDDEVKASRIRVEGHGEAASVRHRRSGVAPIANGVEVWLLEDSSAGE